MMADKKEIPITSNEFNEKFLMKNSSSIVVKKNKYYIEDRGKIEDLDINLMTKSKQNRSIEYLNKLKIQSDTIHNNDILANYLSLGVEQSKKNSVATNNVKKDKYSNYFLITMYE